MKVVALLIRSSRKIRKEFSQAADVPKYVHCNNSQAIQTSWLSSVLLALAIKTSWLSLEIERCTFCSKHIGPYCQGWYRVASTGRLCKLGNIMLLIWELTVLIPTLILWASALWTRRSPQGGLSPSHVFPPLRQAVAALQVINWTPKSSLKRAPVTW